MSATNEAEQHSAARAAIVASLPAIVKDALDWDRSQWVDDGVEASEFYKAPLESARARPGDLLKLEEVSETAKYALPPATALSRFLFQSETLDNVPVPVSGVLIWPYSPRSNKDGGYQVVVWTHGTSGLGPDCAPSHLSNLWQHYLGPFSLVLQGYVVIAPDYAGLGVSKSVDGKAIIHEYVASPAQANDAIHALTAARTAFPQLGPHFVVMGHSQGGGAAWSVAQRQVAKPTDGYLGAVALSPMTNPMAQPEPVASWLGIGMMVAMCRRYPDKAKDIEGLLTPEGQQRRAAIEMLGATTLPSIALLTDCQLFQPGWTTDPRVQDYQKSIESGHREIAGPLLVIQGEEDTLVNVDVVDKAVRTTLGSFPAADVRYLRLPGLDHVPTITGSQRIWQDWIAERFAQVSPHVDATGPHGEQVKPALALPAYQPKLNWYLSVATKFYQTP